MGTRVGGAAAVGRVLRAAAPYAWFLEDEVAGLGELVGPGAVCLDVGAEYGLYTWTLAGLAGPEGRVHAVEPQPGPARFVEATRTLLRADTVSVHRLALATEPGRGTLSLPRRRRLPVHGRAFLTTGADGLGSNDEFAHHDDVPVTVDSLDGLVAGLGLDRLDLVKADIEGAEPALLAGAADTLAALRPVLLLELEDRHLARFGHRVTDVIDGLVGHGYAPRSWDGAWVPHRAERPRRNVLFLPPGHPAQ